MRIILSIFALSMFLISCQEVTIQVFRQCGVMTISDALPVQFWLADCETYNEYEAEGVHRACWCQPWNCDDEIKIQFTDDTSPDLEYDLLIKSSDGPILQEIPINQTQNNTYQLSVIPSDYEICDEQIQFLISERNSTENERFKDLSTWGALGTIWAYRDNNKLTFTEDNDTSQIGTSFTNLDVGGGSVISFYLTIDTNTINGSATAQFYIADGVFTFFEEQTITITPADIGVQTVLIHLTVPANKTAEIMGFVVTDTGSTSVNIDFYFGVQTATETSDYTLIYTGNDAIVAKSDCLDIATAHDETIFIEYSNQRNYAGLIYENDSPDTTFGIRVPSRFVHESFPEEDEAMELTSSIIITSSQQKTQRELEVKHAPYYFHKKLMQILKHQSLSINNIQWKKEENYQLNDGNKRWPLKSATCLLTEKNSPVRNVL